MKIGDRSGTTVLIRTCSGVPQLVRAISIWLEILERITAAMDDRVAFVAGRLLLGPDTSTP
jgi:hypothetical protein